MSCLYPGCCALSFSLPFTLPSPLCVCMCTDGGSEVRRPDSPEQQHENILTTSTETDVSQQQAQPVGAPYFLRFIVVLSKCVECQFWQRPSALPPDMKHERRGTRLILSFEFQISLAVTGQPMVQDTGYTKIVIACDKIFYRLKRNTEIPKKQMCPVCPVW